MYEFAERTVKQYSGNKAKTEFYSQLFIVSTIEAETMSNSVRKFSELHKFMNFSWESFRWLRRCGIIVQQDNSELEYLLVDIIFLIFALKFFNSDC